MYVDKFALGFRLWNRITVLLQSLNVKSNRVLYERNDFIPGLRSGNAPRQIRDVSPESVLTLLNDNQVLHKRYLSPACFKMLFSVPGGTSIPGIPETVTVPGFCGCWS